MLNNILKLNFTLNVVILILFLDSNYIFISLTIAAFTGSSCSRVLCLHSRTIYHSWLDIIYIDLVRVWLVT